MNEDLVKAWVHDNHTDFNEHADPPIFFYCCLVAAGTVVGIFAVLALGLLCTFTVVFIKKSKRVKGIFNAYNVSKGI
jgi:hypothetical protein